MLWLTNEKRQPFWSLLTLNHLGKKWKSKCYKPYPLGYKKWEGRFTFIEIGGEGTELSRIGRKKGSFSPTHQARSSLLLFLICPFSLSSHEKLVCVVGLKKESWNSSCSLKGEAIGSQREEHNSSGRWEIQILPWSFKKYGWRKGSLFQHYI